MASRDIQVLFVDDSAQDYEILAGMLSQISSGRSYRVDHVSDFTRGLEMVLAGGYDLYVIDSRIGPDNGVGLIQQAALLGQDGPFIFLTAFDEPELYASLLNCGVYGYVLKSEMSPALLDRTFFYALERKRVEDELREGQALAAFVMSETPYFIVSVGGDGCISQVNETFCSALELESGAVVGKPWKSVLCENAGSAVRYQVKDNGHIVFRSSVLDGSGRARLVRWHVLSEQFNPFGHAAPASFVLSGIDMTEQVEAEQLERQEQKMKALGHLSGGVAHEINNLLQPIILASQVLKGRIPDDTVLQDMADKIMRNVDAASCVVEDILTFSRHAPGAGDPVPLREVMDEALGIVKDLLPDEVKLKVRGLDDAALSGTVCIRKSDMVRVLSNLIVNAGQAMDAKGRVEMVVRVENISGEAPALGIEPGLYARIDVTDQGKGIASEDLKNIFDPFFTTKAVGQGTGLGLAIVYNVMKECGGAVDVESAPGQGTTFSLYLPYEDGED